MLQPAAEAIPKEAVSNEAAVRLWLPRASAGLWSRGQPKNDVVAQMRSLGERRYPRGEFCQRKRFDQIIVSAAGKACQLVIESVARGQHQYGHAAVCAAAYLGTDAQPVTVRQGEIEQYDINGADQSFPQSGLAIRSIMQPMPKRFEIIDNIAGKIRIVLHQQYVKAVAQKAFPRKYPPQSGVLIVKKASNGISQPHDASSAKAASINAHMKG